jgi:hypothetical protein
MAAESIRLRCWLDSSQRGIRPDLILMADPGSEMTPTLSISWSAPELIVPWILAMATFHQRYEHQKWN